MNTKYIDLINQTFDFPQDEFKLAEHKLRFHDVNLMQLVEQYGAPLKFTYLPQISNNIQRSKHWFNNHLQWRKVLFRKWIKRFIGRKYFSRIHAVPNHPFNGGGY